MGGCYLFAGEKVTGSSYINHFLQPDTIIPDPASPQNLNRYSYVGNRPINFNDPTGHYCAESDGNGKPVRVDCETGEVLKDNSGGRNSGGNGGGGKIPTYGNGLIGPPELPEFWISPSENRTPACYAGNIVQGFSTADVTSGIRDLCGKLDPFLVNPEIVGTNLIYPQMVEQSALYLSSAYGLDPGIASKVSAGLPLGCFAYNCAYDVATGTGEYNLQNISVTPQSVTYTVVAIPIAIPVFIEYGTFIIGILLAPFGL